MKTKNYPMKNIVPFFLLLFISLTNCQEVEVFVDNAPQLEIHVKNKDGQNVKGASVLLFLSEEDWKNEINFIHSASTNSSGTVLFNNLEQKVYYFFVEKGEMNNLLEVATFSSPLRINEIRVIETVIN